MSYFYEDFIEGLSTSLIDPPKLEIILDASQLELFEPCPRKWAYSSLQNLIPKAARRSFDIGSYYHEVLAHYYHLPIADKPIIDMVDRLRSAIDFSAKDDLLRKFNINKTDDRAFHRKRLIEYFTHYQSEDEQIKTIAVEQGFSWLLYEDNFRRYILEGKIDLIMENNLFKLSVMDHKTQSRKDDKWEFNHQVCNYLTYTKANYFIYNYIGLQDKLPPDGMRRMIYKPHEGMLDQWKKEVKLTFDELYGYLKDEKEIPRRRAACDSSKYGLCPFFKLCSVPDDSKWVRAVHSAYKEKEEVWRAWK